jgi:hypothetical protein
LHKDVAHVQDRDGDIELVALQSEVFLEPAELRLSIVMMLVGWNGKNIKKSGVRNVIPIQIVEKVENPNDGHESHVQLSHELLLKAAQVFLVIAERGGLSFAIFNHVDDRLLVGKGRWIRHALETRIE